MTKFALLIGLLLLFQGLTHAETLATQPAVRPPVVSGIVTGTLGNAKEDTAKIAAVLGHHGVLFVRSQSRWDELNKLLPDLMPDTPLRKIDFSKQSVVLVYDTARRSKDAFSYANNTVPPESFFFLRWDNSPEERKESRFAKIILAIIPATPTAKVTVISEPANADRPRKETEHLTFLEFSATLGGKDGGDIVDGLQATITPKATTIKPGEDILIDFELHLANMPDAHPQQFGTAPDTVQVWSASCSEGYRNHGLFVTTPDSKTILLRLKEILFFDNSLQPIAITAKEPYHLPKWAGGDTLRSLKALGVDTSVPGIYTITGLYDEAASSVQEGHGPAAVKMMIWGGSIASNTITVEVKK